MVDGVRVEQIVRTRLVEPAGLAGADVAGEDSGGPQIVAGPLVGIPGSRIAGAVEDQMGLRIVADPAPRIAAADPPAFRLPGGDSEVPPPRGGVERMEIGADQNVRVGTGAPRLPHQGAASRVERGQPAAYAEFAARASDQDPAVRDH